MENRPMPRNGNVQTSFSRRRPQPWGAIYSTLVSCYFFLSKTRSPIAIITRIKRFHVLFNAINSSYHLFTRMPFKTQSPSPDLHATPRYSCLPSSSAPRHSQRTRKDSSSSPGSAGSWVEQRGRPRLVRWKNATEQQGERRLLLQTS
jgi:hypothetical protein